MKLWRCAKRPPADFVAFMFIRFTSRSTRAAMMEFNATRQDNLEYKTAWNWTRKIKDALR